MDAHNELLILFAVAMFVFIVYLAIEGNTPKAKHELKTVNPFFDEIWAGIKKFEIRDCRDRDFKVGDIVRLREYDYVNYRYTGRDIYIKITYVCDYIKVINYVVFSFEIKQKVSKNIHAKQ